MLRTVYYRTSVLKTTFKNFTPLSHAPSVTCNYDRRRYGSQRTAISEFEDLKRLEQIRSRLKSMGAGSVSLSKDQNDPKIAVITLYNEGRRNSLSGKMMCELLDCVESLEQWEEGAGLVLTGDLRENFFCAGADLKVAQDHLLDPAARGGENMSYFMHFVTRKLRSLPIISVAAIEGGCVGGGAELATSCDFRVMSEESYIHFVHAKMSVTPGWGGGTRITKIIGRRAALQLLCGCQRVDSSRAIQIGICDALSAPGSAVSRATELLTEFTRHSTKVTRAMKVIVSRADEDALLPSLTHEHEVFSSLWGNPDNVSAVGKGGAKDVSPR